MALGFEIFDSTVDVGAWYDAGTGCVLGGGGRILIVSGGTWLDDVYLVWLTNEDDECSPETLRWTKADCLAWLLYVGVGEEPFLKFTSFEAIMLIELVLPLFFATSEL